MPVANSTGSAVRESRPFPRDVPRCGLDNPRRKTTATRLAESPPCPALESLGIACCTPGLDSGSRMSSHPSGCTACRLLETRSSVASMYCAKPPQGRSRFAARAKSATPAPRRRLILPEMAKVAASECSGRCNKSCPPCCVSPIQLVQMSSPSAIEVPKCNWQSANEGRRTNAQTINHWEDGRQDELPEEPGGSERSTRKTKATAFRILFCHFHAVSPHWVLFKTPDPSRYGKTLWRFASARRFGRAVGGGLIDPPWPVSVRSRLICWLGWPFSVARRFGTPSA